MDALFVAEIWMLFTATDSGVYWQRQRAAQFSGAICPRSTVVRVTCQPVSVCRTSNVADIDLASGQLGLYLCCRLAQLW